MKGLLVCELLRSTGSSGQHTCGQNVEAKVLRTLRLSMQRLVSGDKTLTYTPPQPQLFFMHDLSLF